MSIGRTGAVLLASSSMSRRMLLKRLGVPFDWVAPDVDETPRDGESADELAERLAVAKAQAVAVDQPNRVIIGSDQVACLDGRLIGKPGNHDAAFAQLRAAAGRSLKFSTAVALHTPVTRITKSAIAHNAVRFRPLTDQQIERYLRHEKPYGCAGSFKAEGQGIALFETLEGDDPSALIGLPLIALTTLLAEAGLDVLTGIHAQSIWTSVPGQPKNRSYSKRY